MMIVGTDARESVPGRYILLFMKFYLFWKSITQHIGLFCHYNIVIMSAMGYQIISLTIFYSTVYLGADQRKHQSSVSLAFV